jgi:hypothetical protein
MSCNTTGYGNTAHGYRALYANKTGFFQQLVLQVLSLTITAVTSLQDFILIYLIYGIDHLILKS